MAETVGTQAGSANASVSQHSFSLTVESATNSVVVIGVHFSDMDATVSSVSVGGTAGTQVARANPANSSHASEMWVVVDPPAGSQTVEVNLSATAESSATAQQLQDVDQTTPARDWFATQGQGGGGEVISGTVDSSADDVVIGTVAANGTTAMVPGDGVTTIRSTTTSDVAYMGWMAGAAPTQTFSVTNNSGANVDWSLVVASFQSPSGGGGGSSIVPIAMNYYRRRRAA